MTSENKFSLYSLLHNNKFLVVISFIIAFIVWITVSLNESPEVERVIENVKVNVDESVPSQLGYKAFGGEDIYIDITVRGKRYLVGDNVLNAEDFDVVALSSKVDKPGRYTLQVKAVPKNAQAGYTIIAKSKDYVEIYFDQPKTLVALIVTGGIGFLTWDDIKRHRLHFQKYRMQTRVILTVTAALILCGATFMFFFEFSDLPLKERLLCSFFQSVTPRTAGFNTIDLNTLSETGQLLLVILMVIGGSPGSTAGGMKTTTIAVLIAVAIAVFTRREEPRLFKRRITPEAVHHAATICMMYIGLFVVGAMIISYAEGVPILTALLETSSAIGTVGLSLGITPEVGMLSKCILIFLMFFGRVGALTMVYAAVTPRRTYGSKYPQEKITVG